MFVSCSLYIYWLDPREWILDEETREQSSLHKVLKFNETPKKIYNGPVGGLRKDRLPNSI